MLQTGNVGRRAAFGLLLHYPAGCATAGAAAAGFFAGFGFFTATFFRAAFSCSALAALTAAHLLFVAAMILAMPALLIRRLGLVASSGAGSVAFLAAAHLLRCASAILARLAALIFRRLRFGASDAAAVLAGPPGRRALSSAILAASFSFWTSIPRIAAFKISGVSFVVGMRLDLPRFFHRKGDAVTHTTPTAAMRRLSYLLRCGGSNVESLQFRDSGNPCDSGFDRIHAAPSFGGERR
ncbi:MAG: hypothetical protein ABSH44_11270 [Bryobacteraceae bacterium]